MVQSPGEHIAALRQTYNVTREALAERSGLDVELIRRIEEDGSIPDLAPLVRIARALGVRLGTILDESDALGPVVTRAGQAREAERFFTGAALPQEAPSSGPRQGAPALRFHSLSAGKSSRHMEPFIVDVEAGALQEKSAHEGEEFIHVLAGKMTLEYGKDRYTLGAGDSIYYDSIVPHRVLSAPDTPVPLRILAVIYTPV